MLTLHFLTALCEQQAQATGAQAAAVAHPPGCCLLCMYWHRVLSRAIACASRQKQESP